MSDVTGGSFPRRDAQRRIVVVRDLAAMMVAGAVAGTAALAVLDGAFALIGLGDFGEVNGWLAVILPVMLLVEEFRAWRGTRARLLVAPLTAVVAIGVGLLVVRLAGGLPALAAGALGAIAFSAAYAPLWFYGIRLADELAAK